MQITERRPREREIRVRGPGEGVENHTTRGQYPDEERICRIPGTDE